MNLSYNEGSVMLKDELEFFIANQSDFVSRYQGKVLIIKGKKVVGVFPDVLRAYLEGQKQYEIGTFLIQPCVPGPDAYTITIASQEIFPR